MMHRYSQFFVFSSLPWIVFFMISLETQLGHATFCTMLQFDDLFLTVRCKAITGTRGFFQSIRTCQLATLIFPMRFDYAIVIDESICQLATVM